MIIFSTYNVISPVAAFLMALNVGFTHPQAKQAVCVAQYESALRIKAKNVSNKNGSVDHGLMQINTIWAKGLCKDLDLYDPQSNFECAYRVFNATTRTFNPWVAYKKNKDICTVDYTISECREPKLIDRLEEKNFKFPKVLIKSATRVCKEKYHGCLKKLIRTGDMAYRAICGGA
jgi:hypothetical protein